MGFYEGLNEEKYDRQYKDSALTKRIAHYFTAARGQVTVIVFLVVLMAVIAAAQPIVVSRGLDALKGHPTLTSSLIIGLIVLFTGVADWGLNWIRRRLSARAVADVILNLRT